MNQTLYHIKAYSPTNRFFSIEMRIPLTGSTETCLYLPAWRPGRYELQNYAQNIQYVRASDEHGHKVKLKKVSRNCWAASTQGLQVLQINYRFYANQPDAGGSYLANDVWYINWINCLLFADHTLEMPCEVQLELPENFQIACGLPSEGTRLFAPDFRTLADAPMLASPALQHASYFPANSPHTEFHLWILGNCTPNWETMCRDFKAFTEYQIGLFGEFPASDFHFIFWIPPFNYYHGVEHANSTMMVLGPDAMFEQPAFYDNILGLACHELFHAWNIVRIRPAELMPYQFKQESYFTTGYVVEGVTTYYGDYILCRSGVWSVEQYLKELSESLERHGRNFGRRHYSLAEASHDLWVDGYKRSSPHRNVSIYTEGCLAALVLDCKIRLNSSGSRSLDDVMRLLWLRFGKPQKGYTENDYMQLINEVAGCDMSAYFEEFIHRPADFHKVLMELMPQFGCKLDKKATISWHESLFGFGLVQQGSDCVVNMLVPGSPADGQLSTGDVLLAVDGIPVNTLPLMPLLPREHMACNLKIKRWGQEYSLFLENRAQNDWLPLYEVTLRYDRSLPENKRYKNWLLGEE